MSTGVSCGRSTSHRSFRVFTLRTPRSRFPSATSGSRRAEPVVMLSSKDGVFDKARGRMVGCQEYLTKPFTKDQLLQAVQQFGNSQQGAM